MRIRAMGRVTMVSLACLLVTGAARGGPEAPIRLPASAENLLVGAKVSGNLESYDQGLRGRPDHMVYDAAKGRFLRDSQWHEYGVGFGSSLGIVPEARPAWWMAEWSEPVEANLIILSGTYPNQPQPDTAWKIEVRRDGKWIPHARGIGGWYDRGRYVWGGPGADPLRIDGLRVSAFSKDDATPIKSIHFRGEKDLSWVVARVAPIDAAIRLPRLPIRAGQRVRFAGEALAGEVASWRWDLGGGASGEGREVEHAFDEPGTHEIALTFSDGRHTLTTKASVDVASPVAVRIVPLSAPVLAGRPVRFRAEPRYGRIETWTWDFGDGTAARGREVEHTFATPGIRKVRLVASDGRYTGDGLALVRVHSPETLEVPQVVLDTDQKNEQDDQHYFGYGLFSELDILGVDSVHHGGGQEPINYAEILHVLDLARQSGLSPHREPFIFRGADERLVVPDGGRWKDTLPNVTEASEAILAAARGASPSNPVWVVPVGPGTNVASAILQARDEGLELKDRLRVMWLGGSNGAIAGEFNGNNDPWSMYVVCSSGLEVWIMPAPVGARVAIDKRTEGHLYAEHPLGQYLRQIVPARPKPLFDPSCLSAVISLRLDLGWIEEVERVTVGGPDAGYAWTRSDAPDAVRVIRRIDQRAMRRDLFDTMDGKPTRLAGR
ncbi:MAG: PKD domain-containing protein [Planctomycetes bacterium]|nr:PKD domain-containing protein [Planctomycetota bacterium]